VYVEREAVKQQRLIFDDPDGVVETLRDGTPIPTTPRQPPPPPTRTIPTTLTENQASQLQNPLYDTAASIAETNSKMSLESNRTFPKMTPKLKRLVNVLSKWKLHGGADIRDQRMSQMHSMRVPLQYAASYPDIYLASVEELAALLPPFFTINAINGKQSRMMFTSVFESKQIRAWMKELDALLAECDAVGKKNIAGINVLDADLQSGALPGKDRFHSLSSNVKSALNQFFTLVIAAEWNTETQLMPCVEMLADPVRMNFVINISTMWTQSPSTSYCQLKAFTTVLKKLETGTTQVLAALRQWFIASHKMVLLKRQEAKTLKDAFNNNKMVRQQMKSVGLWMTNSKIAKVRELLVEYHQLATEHSMELLEANSEHLIKLNNGRWIPLRPQCITDLQGIFQTLWFGSWAGPRLQHCAKALLSHIELCWDENYSSSAKFLRADDPTFSIKRIASARWIRYGGFFQKRNDVVCLSQIFCFVFFVPLGFIFLLFINECLLTERNFLVCFVLAKTGYRLTPDILTPLFAMHVALVRLCLRPEGTTALFIGHGGKAMKFSDLSLAVGRTTWNAAGNKFIPSMWRRGFITEGVNFYMSAQKMSFFAAIDKVALLANTSGSMILRHYFRDYLEEGVANDINQLNREMVVQSGNEEQLDDIELARKEHEIQSYFASGTVVVDDDDNDDDETNEQVHLIFIISLYYYKYAFLF
jgi:hypothetical protein